MPATGSFANSFLTNGTESNSDALSRAAVILAHIVMRLDNRSGSTGCGGDAVLDVRQRGRVSQTGPDGSKVYFERTRYTGPGHERGNDEMTTTGSWLAAITLGLGLAAAPPAGADTWQPLEAWRIDAGRIAPWAPPGARIDLAYRGQEVRFEAARTVAPHPLACDGATYEWIVSGPEGLFEGNLPAPAAQAARRLGLDDGAIATLRVSCANAGFDFHRTSSGALLLGLDNVVWTLRPIRPASTPAEIVQELLVMHFTHDMGFTRESVARKRGFLSTDLQARIARYLAAPGSPDEAPAINGDPFTDSQEYPDRFRLGAVRTTPTHTIGPGPFRRRQLEAARRLPAGTPGHAMGNRRSRRRTRPVAAPSTPVTRCATVRRRPASASARSAA